MMKKLLFFGMMGAMALTFVACSSEDDAFTTPKVTGETVKTTFTFNVPLKQMTTRMTAGQAGETESTTFKGISDIKLIPFATAEAVKDGDVLGLDVITLANLTAFNEKGLNNNSFNGNVYNDVEVPVGVNHFVFYGLKADNSEGGLDAVYATTAKGSKIENYAKFNMVPFQKDLEFSGLASKSTNGQAVLTALNKVSAAFTANPATGTSFESIFAELKAAFESNKAGSAASVNALFTELKAALNNLADNDAKTAILAAIDDLSSNKFPADLNLPDGAIGVTCTSGTWTFANSNVNGLGQPAPKMYVKPAALWYTINTPIKTDTEIHQPEYKNQNSWDNVVALYDDATAVTSETRAIALVNEIQFAVGQLQSQVKVAESVDLKANDMDSQNQPKVIYTNAAASFAVTGILIGGQDDLTWKFLPATTSGAYVIYDGKPTTAGNATAAAASPVNYTLAGETAKDQKVKVLVELVNGATPFQGFNKQLIPANAKFYLLAELDPKTATGYNASTLNSVFKQDYATKVTFTIGAESLKNAYNTIPDLRTPKLELGLAVNLEWQQGLVFENIAFQ